jgi:hypothetical protein
MAEEQKYILEHELLSPLVTPDAGEVKILKFRAPRAGDIMRCGQPVKLDVQNSDISFDEVKMGSMMSALSAVPPSFLANMDPRDWNTIAWGLAPFFLPRMA